MYRVQSGLAALTGLHGVREGLSLIRTKLERSQFDVFKMDFAVAAISSAST